MEAARLWSARQSVSPIASPLPKLLQTPSGLAILEIQGTIHISGQDGEDSNSTVDVGKLVFPHYSAEHSEGDMSWMKSVHLYVGKHQRLTGEVKKLVKPIAIIERQHDSEGDLDDATTDLKVAEIIHYKVVFSQRPEPVGEDAAP